MSKLTIYVVRHGKTIMNTLGRTQGWCDSPLTKEGREVAGFLGKGLKDISFQSAYCSTLRRTKQTAQIILETKGQAGLPIVEEEGFKEAGFGSFESGLNKSLWKKISLYMGYANAADIDIDLAKGILKYGDFQDVIAKIDEMQIAETWHEVESRTQKALNKVAQEELAKGSENVLIVAHGMCIGAMLLSLGGDKIIRGDIDNASVSKVTYENGKFTIKSIGDMSYVEKGKTSI